MYIPTHKNTCVRGTCTCKCIWYILVYTLSVVFITYLFWFYPTIFRSKMTIFDPSDIPSSQQFGTTGCIELGFPAGKDWRIHWTAGAGRRKTDPVKESSMIKGIPCILLTWTTKVLIWVGGGSSILTFPRDIKIHEVMLAISHDAFTYVIPDINQKVLQSRRMDLKSQGHFENSST